VMGFEDPFFGYSFLLRSIVYVAVPVFGVLQVVRMRRTLHVFQLEGYKRDRFLRWCAQNRKRALFLTKSFQKKPLVMTGRAWRLLSVAVVSSVALVLAFPALAHLYLGGWPADVASWVVVTALVFVFSPRVLVGADLLLAPVQKGINARYVRSARSKLRAVSPVVVGITGSFGKTSTKYAIAALIAPEKTVLATPSSFNTPLGVCRTINEDLSEQHRFFVVEMGAYRVGDIASLCDFVHPVMGVLTAVGPAHLERFGSMENIRKGKYELIESLPPNGIAIMNVDDPEVRKLADRTEHVEVVRYGLEPEGRPDVTAREVEATPEGTSLTIVDLRSGESIEAETKLVGRYAVGQVLSGVAAALSVGRELAQLPAAVSKLEPVDHRLKLIRGAGGITVIDDAYNSNPDGARAALEVLEAMPGGRKVVVTPGMVELGELQEEANREFAQQAGKVADLLIAVARINRDALVEGATAGGRAEVITVDSLAEAQGHLAKRLGEGDVVLFENDLPDQYEQ
jgi:UDP-N-acetylmuramoyl-tripeptide--D-alanyl-D-alanine ligase